MQALYVEMVPQVYAQALDEVRLKILNELCLSNARAVVDALSNMLEDVLTHYYQEDWHFTLERAKEELKKVRNCNG